MGAGVSPPAAPCQASFRGSDHSATKANRWSPPSRGACSMAAHNGVHVDTKSAVLGSCPRAIRASDRVGADWITAFKLDSWASVGRFQSSKFRRESLHSSLLVSLAAKLAAPQYLSQYPGVWNLLPQHRHFLSGRVCTSIVFQYL